ncbi:MAG: class I SAM-dependent methyltransferase, partial [Lentisphaerae bacterium]|nr:class I SAM-dependent methyltransferase [Lentisphaerota bacterium]
VYDRLTQDIDRKKIADFIERLFKRHDFNPVTVLDLGCGTGGFCVEMHERGYDVIGVDISPDMLSCAKTRMLEKGVDILLINQDMTELKLNGKADAAICLVDGVNHITDPRKILKFFFHVKKFLNPGGLFIFDINTRYKLEAVMRNNVFYNIDDDVACIWQCGIDESGISESDITLFVKKGDLYERFDETICERAYDDIEIRKFINDAGFELLGVYDGTTFKEVNEKSERVFYACRR